MQTVTREWRYVFGRINTREDFMWKPRDQADPYQNLRDILRLYGYYSRDHGKEVESTTKLLTGEKAIPEKSKRL